jgi:hypothetical protein
MADEADAAAEARAAGGKVRPRRMQEKEALVARTFLQQTGLPAPTIPELAERKRLLADLAAEDAAYDALVAEAEAEAAKASEAAGEKVAAVIPVRELGVAYRSFDAWYNLLHGEFSEHDADVPDRWLTIWEQYSEDDTVALHAAIAGREMRLHTVVAGVMSVPEKMNNVAKLRVRTAMEKYSKDDTFAQLVAAAAGAYDLARQGLGVEAWEASAAAILAHGDFPKKTTIETLTRVFDDAIYSLA